MAAPRLSSALRNAVWVQYNGLEHGTAKCYCCDLQTVSAQNFACGHVRSRALGGLDTLSNLRPVCVNCNSSMGKHHMYNWCLAQGFTGRIVKEGPPVISTVEGSELKEVSSGPRCALCLGEFAAATLQKYDGLHCGRCFAMVKTALEKDEPRLPIPEEATMSEKGDALSSLPAAYVEAIFPHVELSPQAKLAALVITAKELRLDEEFPFKLLSGADPVAIRALWNSARISARSK